MTDENSQSDLCFGFIFKKSNFINKKLLCYHKQMTNIKLKKNANIMKFNSRRSALCHKIFVLHTIKPDFHVAATKFWCTWKEPVTAIRLLEFRHWFLIDHRTHEFSIDSINPPLQRFPNLGFAHWIWVGPGKLLNYDRQWSHWCHSEQWWETSISFTQATLSIELLETLFYF